MWKNSVNSLIMLRDGNQILNGTVKEIREKFGRTKLFLESPLSLDELKNNFRVYNQLWLIERVFLFFS